MVRCVRWPPEAARSPAGNAPPCRRRSSRCARRFLEPCSVALIEALALGVPVIASASGGNVDIVADGVTGCLFRPDDVEDLTAKLGAMVRGEIRPAAPEVSRESVRQRSASAVAEEYLALYRERITARRRAP
ncbi:MAG: glycosyltransferase [Verrucomicrobiota bacterium]